MTVEDDIDITGLWSYTMRVFEVTVGGCPDDEVNNHQITITNNANNITLSGFFMDPMSELDGVYDPVNSTPVSLLMAPILKRGPCRGRMN